MVTCVGGCTVCGLRIWYSETCPNDHSHIATTCVHRPEFYVPTKSPLKAVLLYLRKAATWLMRPTAITLRPEYIVYIQLYLLERP